MFGTLREARLRLRLTQRQLAQRLGLHQRQISDLERATVDPRHSTIQNVARALDLELVLIPRSLITVVDALQRAGANQSARPLYELRSGAGWPDPSEREPSDDGAASVTGDEKRLRRGSGPRS